MTPTEESSSNEEEAPDHTWNLRPYARVLANISIRMYVGQTTIESGKMMDYWL